mmetsp:Transcript_37104/g.86947  ORF Transcript_37104/g.86947 Transcript_37104/m.86947 type:complete len:99 (+) Transcript_37104:498-794(+)
MPLATDVTRVSNASTPHMDASEVVNAPKAAQNPYLDHSQAFEGGSLYVMSTNGKSPRENKVLKKVSAMNMGTMRHLRKTMAKRQDAKTELNELTMDKP